MHQNRAPVIPNSTEEHGQYVVLHLGGVSPTAHSVLLSLHLLISLIVLYCP